MMTSAEAPTGSGRPPGAPARPATPATPGAPGTPTPLEPPAKPRSRASRLLKANAVVVVWLGLTVLAALAGDALPAPRWLLVHLFLLGAVTSAILIWSEHFTVTLLHARPRTRAGALPASGPRTPAPPPCWRAPRWRRAAS